MYELQDKLIKSTTKSKFHSIVEMTILFLFLYVVTAICKIEKML